MALGYTDYEEGYRHGKRDFACGLRSPALLAEHNDYAKGYRKGLKESEATYAEWLEREGRIGVIVPSVVARGL